jgi:hypothetical protein
MEEVIKLHSRVSDPKRPTFTKTIIFDQNEKGGKSKRWERLEKESANIRTILKEYGDGIKMKKIGTFTCNGKIVKVTDLYSFTGNVYCVFGVEKNKNSDDRNILGLFVVGAKTAKELEYAGYTRDKGSFLPLFVCVNGSSVTMLNSL